MGQNGLSTLLGIAKLKRYEGNLPPDTLQKEFSFEDIAAINLALEEMYGVRGGRGMALRIGQSAFAQGIKYFGAMKGMNDPAFRSLALEKRIEYGLLGLSAIMTNFSDQTSHLVQDGSALMFVSEQTPFSYGRQSDKPVCHMMVGMLIETLRWSSNGYDFYVREINCCATGSHQCTFRINRSLASGRRT